MRGGGRGGMVRFGVYKCNKRKTFFFFFFLFMFLKWLFYHFFVGTSAP
jgi:hypothetical protein